MFTDGDRCEKGVRPLAREVAFSSQRRGEGSDPLNAPAAGEEREHAVPGLLGCFFHGLAGLLHLLGCFLIGLLGQVDHGLRRRVGRYEEGWTQVRELGGVVKDPQIGLVDFYGRIDGRVVWLCWRYGEDALGYYHELDSGYPGRRPLSADVRRSLLN